MNKLLDLVKFIVMGIGALFATGTLVVTGMRALWLYRTPVWLRRVLLLLLGGGIAAIVAGIVWSSEWFVVGGLSVAIGPLGTWLVVRSIFYAGPPPGLLEGPAALETADDVLDAVGGIVGLEHSEERDEDDA